VKALDVQLIKVADHEDSEIEAAYRISSTFL
jgi:hypothetical protein